MMTHPGKAAQAAIVTGLGIALAAGPAATAFAATGAQGTADTPVVGEAANPEFSAQVGGTSRGDTKLYVIARQDDLTTLEGATNEQLRVSIPVAIHYVADSEGNLAGPSDDVVKFVNHTRLGAVHVSKIKVEADANADIARTDKVGTANDRLSFKMQPVQGQSDSAGESFTPVAKFTEAQAEAYQGNASDYTTVGTVDELGNYSTSASGENAGGGAINPTGRNDWNIAQKHGALGLNKLEGTIGGFDKISPLADYNVGTIHWTVRAGTRRQADTRDSQLTIHFNSNNGFNANCVPIADQNITLLSAAALPGRVLVEGAGNIAVTAGSSTTGGNLEAPKSITLATGKVRTYSFKGWSTDPNANGNAAGTSYVTKVSDIYPTEDAQRSAAGGTVELYAIFGYVDV